MVATAQPQDWVRLSASKGAKGPHDFEWLRMPLLPWPMPGERWLLLRRSLADGKLSYYVCYVPPGTDLAVGPGLRLTLDRGGMLCRG